MLCASHGRGKEEAEILGCIQRHGGIGAGQSLGRAGVGPGTGPQGGMVGLRLPVCFSSPSGSRPVNEGAAPPRGKTGRVAEPSLLPDSLSRGCFWSILSVPVVVTNEAELIPVSPTMPLLPPSAGDTFRSFLDTSVMGCAFLDCQQMQIRCWLRYVGGIFSAHPPHHHPASPAVRSSLDLC